MRKLLPLILILLLPAFGCTLLNPPAGPIIPTAIPTPPSVIKLEDLRENPPVVNPLDAAELAQDPDIITLMNNVSQQNLLGYVQTMQGFGTRHVLSETQNPAFGVGAARTWIFDEFNRVGAGRLQVAFDDFIFPYAGQRISQQNVIATLPGTGPHPGVIVVMAHYDSRTYDLDDGQSLSPGADDNASGVASLLEVARLMSSRTWNQTVLFVAFGAEEQGRFGSLHFVQEAFLQGLPIDIGINNDVVGGRPGIPQSIRVFSPGPDTSSSRQVARYIHLIGSLYLPDFAVIMQDAMDRPGRFSDHRTFIEAGIPAVRITESEENFNTQHSALDTWDRMDYAYLARATQLNLAVVANLAGAPPPPAPPNVAPMADPGSYLLNWTPSPLAAGYAVSFRPQGESAYNPANFRYVSAAQAGNVAYTGLDPAIPYAVSLAALDANGRISNFSPAITISGQ